jgi:hypothetical protein
LGSFDSFGAFLSLPSLCRLCPFFPDGDATVSACQLQALH